MRDANKAETEIKTYRGTFWGLLILLTLACISHPFIIRWAYSLCSSAKHLEQCGQIGDCFGALNAFISGCAFIAVVVSMKQQTEQLKLQREDLKNQRADLALQREEMKKSREEAEAQTQQFKEQVKIGEKAQFNDNFYRRLELLKSLSNNVAFDGSSTDMDGTEIIREQSGSLAWKNFHLMVMRALSGKDNIQSFIYHTEALTAIAAWHKTLVTLINDVIDYFPDGDKDNMPSNAPINHIKIIYNSLTEFEMDFHILFLDILQDDTNRRAKEKLYELSSVLHRNIENCAFAQLTPHRKSIIQTLRAIFL